MAMFQCKPSEYSARIYSLPSLHRHYIHYIRNTSSLCVPLVRMNELLHPSYFTHWNNLYLLIFILISLWLYILVFLSVLLSFLFFEWLFRPVTLIYIYIRDLSPIYDSRAPIKITRTVWKWSLLKKLTGVLFKIYY